MIQQNKSREDKAWNKLYDRLENDGLLVDEIEESQERRSPGYTSWAAIAAAIIGVAVVFSVLINRQNMEENLLTLSNDENSSTLVSTLDDGSRIYMANNTSVTKPKVFKREKREIYLNGDAFFEVSKNPDRPFIIETDLLKVEVLGTSFNIISNNVNNPTVSVNTGVVRVTVKNSGVSRVLNAGESAVIMEGDILDNKIDAGTEFSKYREAMHFKDESLENVVDIINQTSGKTPIIVSDKVKERLITATLPGRDPKAVVNLICSAMNLKKGNRDGSIVIYE